MPNHIHEKCFSHKEMLPWLLVVQLVLGKRKTNPCLLPNYAEALTTALIPSEPCSHLSWIQITLLKEAPCPAGPVPLLEAPPHSVLPPKTPTSLAVSVPSGYLQTFYYLAPTHPTNLSIFPEPAVLLGPRHPSPASFYPSQQEGFIRKVSGWKGKIGSFRKYIWELVKGASVIHF